MSTVKSRRALGIALSLTGVPIGMYLNYVFPILHWSPVVMTIAAALTIHYGQFARRRLSSPSPVICLILVFQILMICYGLMSGRMSWQFFSFHIFIIAFAVAVSSKRLDSEEIEKCIVLTFLLSGLCTLLGSYYLWGGLLAGEEAWHRRQDNPDYALEAFTASLGAITNLACALYIPRLRRALPLVVLLPIAALDVYIIVFAGKRTPILIAAAIVAIFLIKCLDIGNWKGIAAILISSLIAISAFLMIEPLRTQVESAATNIFFGIQNIFGFMHTSDETGSGAMRYESRVWAYEHIFREFSLINYFFGSGYMTMWLDNPVLQSYVDMGVIGVLSYTLIVIVYPLTVAVKRLQPHELFALSLCVYNILSCLSSGNPYQYFKYVPVIVLSAFCSSLPRADGLRH